MPWSEVHRRQLVGEALFAGHEVVAGFIIGIGPVLAGNPPVQDEERAPRIGGRLGGAQAPNLPGRAQGRAPSAPSAPCALTRARVPRLR